MLVLIFWQVISLVFSPLHCQHHTEPILAADTCLWKNYCVTVAKDRSLMLWDYHDHNLLLKETFKEDLYSVALHPTGIPILQLPLLFNKILILVYVV